MEKITPLFFFKEQKDGQKNMQVFIRDRRYAIQLFFLAVKKGTGREDS